MLLGDRDISIGRIAGPFGIKGELKVVVETDFPERFDAGNKVTLVTDKGRRVAKVLASRPNAGGLLMKLEGVDTRDAAEELRQAEIVIDRDELGELEQGSFYVFDIIGLKVLTEDGREWGEVTEVIQSGANDVYVTSTGLCIPALKNVVAKIDLEKREMLIEPMHGLLPEE
jgi:16S rRNA processing protein RimM